MGVGFVTTHVVGVRYLKSLRGEITKKPTTVYEFILTSTLFAGFVLLMHYGLFKEDREADKLGKHSNILIISGIVITIIQIIIIVLLIVFKVITFENVGETTKVFGFQNLLF